MIPVTRRALFQRINRAIVKGGQRLRASRGAKARQRLGAFYVVDAKTNAVVNWGLELGALGRELDALRPGEELHEG